MSEAIVLADGSLRLEFNPASGALTCLVSEDWRILDRPHLGLAWRLIVPVGRRRNNPAEGHEQRLASAERSADGKRLRLVWDRVRPLHGDELEIRVVQDVSVQDGAATWVTTIENRSPHTVEAVFSPSFGDLCRPPQAEWFKSTVRDYAGSRDNDLWPKFSNHKGYFGVDLPTQTAGRSHATPTSPFILFRSADRGLYLGVGERSWELVNWQGELYPGYTSVLSSMVPEGGRIGRYDVAVRYAAVHLPYVAPGETRCLTPVVARPYRGGWEAGCDIYRRSTSVCPPTAQAPAWLREPHAWLQIHVNSPEGEARIPYRMLPEIAAECARHGIKAIQVTGWNLGGQDQNNPCHDTDPLLGTWQELKDAIAASQAMGVHIILFSKFTWADRATDRFRTELIRQSVKDPYGDFYQMVAYQYQTPMQLLDINTKRLIPMCFLSEAYLKVCEEEFAKIIALGAHGHLFDECQHHTPAMLCFDPAHGHRVGAPVYAGDNTLIERFNRLAPAGFLHAGEANYDWEFAVYHMSYFRSESAWHVPFGRYIRPDTQMMTAVCGFDDRHMVNQCLMHRYIMSYEPFNFKGRPEDFPITLAYGEKMDALRTELRQWFWDAEYRSQVPARVMVGGKAHPHWSAFRAADGRHAAVIVNYDETKPLTGTLQWNDGQAPGTWRLVDTPAWQPAGAGIVVPPRSAAVVVPAR